VVAWCLPTPRLDDHGGGGTGAPVDVSPSMASAMMHGHLSQCGPEVCGYRAICTNAIVAEPAEVAALKVGRFH